jgi:hypothetical protein
LRAAEIGEDILLMTPSVPWDAGLGRDQGTEGDLVYGDPVPHTGPALADPGRPEIDHHLVIARYPRRRVPGGSVCIHRKTRRAGRVFC